MEKVKVYTVEFGGESVTGPNLNECVEMLIGIKHIELLEPENGENETSITITVSHISKEQFDSMPEYQ